MKACLIHKVKCQITIKHRLSGEKLLYSPSLNANNLKSIFLQIMRNSATIESIHLNKLEINLGAIPVEQFDRQFTQRLAQVFAERLAQEQASICRLVNIKIPNVTKPTVLLNSRHFNKEALFHHALYYLQPPILGQQRQLPPSGQLQQLLKRLLQHAWQSPEKLPASDYNRVTDSRLLIASLLYLLNSEQGRDWLSRRSPTAAQLNDWGKAVTFGEIPFWQLAQLLAGKHPFNRVSLDQSVHLFAITKRWRLPLWQQKTVRHVIRSRWGADKAQQIDVYLSCCLQPRENFTLQDDRQLGINFKSVKQHQNSRHLLNEKDKVTSFQDVIKKQDPCNVQDDKQILTDSQVVRQNRHRSLLDSKTANPAPLYSFKERQTGYRCPQAEGTTLSSYCINDTGLVLLWPLLPQLFSQLIVCEEQRFISVKARWEAVDCLSWLAWGEQKPTAEPLALNQLLCGLPLEKTGRIPPLLSDAQQQFLNEWLMDIGQQIPGWQSLSLMDIRQLFLQRPGEILIETSNTMINVKSTPYDFLLRDLPWPMTLASFPWLEHPISIKWPLYGLTG